MGNRVLVKPHSEPSTQLISIKPERKGGKPHYMGGCMLKSVTLTVDGIKGDLLDEYTEARELSEDVLKHLTRVFPTDSGWVKVTGTGKDAEPETVTGNQYRAAYICGSEFYVG